MAKPKRTRTARREADRGVEKYRQAALKVYSMEAGGSAARAIPIGASSQIEPDAEATPCAFCRSTVRVVSHDAAEEAGRRVRVVSLECRACHAPWKRYYVIAQAN